MSPLTLKWATVVLIVGAGLAGSFFVIKNAAPDKSSVSGVSLSSESAAAPTLSESAVSAGKPIGRITLPKPKSANLSERFAEKLFNKLISDNPSGPQTAGGDYSINANTSSLIENFIKDELNQTASEPATAVKDEDLKIIADNSDAAYTAYFKSVKAVIEGIMATPRFQTLAAALSSPPPFDAEGNKLNLSPYAQAALEMESLYSQIIKELLAIAVPSGLKEIHKQGLALMMIQQKAMTAFRFAETDPLKSILIMQRVKAESANLADLFSKIDAVVKERDLNI